MANGEAIAYHGWGFDHTCWQGWAEQFASRSIHFTAADRGYFGRPVQPTFSQASGLKVVLTFSYGLHWCPVEILQQADLLVILGGFLSFHPSEAVAGKRSRRVLQRMIQKFETDSVQVLSEFQTACYAPLVLGTGELPCALTGEMNHELLLTDLRHLDTVGMSGDRVSTIPQIIAIHGDADQIVAPLSHQELLAHLPSHSQRVEIPKAGHAIGITHRSECWSIVSQGLP